MISLEDSMPQRGSNYLIGQDVIWTQFNDVNFYVEDIDQENFYFQVLKKLFPNIKLNKIFPLGGKPLVIKEATKSLRNKKKVFILDLDFDEILSIKEPLKNIFYLNKYSIENYLIEKNAVLELIKEENTKIKDIEISKKFDMQLFFKECQNILSELASNFLLIQKYDLGLSHLKIDSSRDCDFLSKPCKLKPSVTTAYFSNVERVLKEKKPRLKYSAQIARPCPKRVLAYFL